MSQNNSKFIGAVFLVSGTSIGAGMLAQPVAASLIGFIPSTMMMIVAWVFMTSIALILLEVCLWMKQDTHIISMAEQFLGPVGKIVSWVAYLFIAYLSLAAYVLGTGNILKTSLINLLPGTFPDWALYALFIFIFGIVIEVGTKAVGRINSFLFAGLVLSYFFIVWVGVGGIELEKLAIFDFSQSYFIIPLFITSFSFQIIVPSLATYLDRNRAQLRLALVLGTTLSLVIYLLWNAIVLGQLTPGAIDELALGYQEGFLPINALSGEIKSWYNIFVNVFAFFALSTSFIGLSWGLFDFLADGLKVVKAGKNRLGLWLLVMLPPYIFALSYPRGFVAALETTGAFGDTILNGIIPILMFWIGCYRLNKSTQSNILKNRVVLGLLIAFSLIVIGLEAVYQFGS